MDFDLRHLDDIPDPLPAASGDSASKDVKARLTEQVAERPSPTRREVVVRRVAAVVVGVGWVLGNLALIGLRSDAAMVPWSYLAAQVAVPMVVAAGALGLAMAAGRVGLGSPRAWLLAVATGGPAALLLLTYAWPAPYSVPAGAGAVANAMPCLGAVGVWSAVPLIFLTMGYRRAFPAAAGARAGLLGLACGAFAGATMNLHCENVAPLHMALGHGLPTLLASAFAAAFLARWVRS